MNGFGTPHYPFSYYNRSSLSTPPYLGYGSYARALEIKLESMFQKPSNIWTPPPFKYGSTPAWTPRQEMENNSSIDEVKIKGLNANNGYMNVVGESLTSVVTKSTVVATSADHHRRTNKEGVSDFEYAELDLSLKL
ncbi:hypothetical protein TSUD_112840 [Trifolium subterraneum]|uniref:Uncharacterized protein n=1 Tax=Trifolium subterraneum TaxID=3900 RepID=A0A2Z6LTX4_TRISU|nr:hypothetical protein TSUD_112840 [Trifolium subterraneum]